MPYYSDLGYYSGHNSAYSPYTPSSSYSLYSRPLSSPYSPLPPRSAYSSNVSRHYTPILKPICESTYRSNALTSLTRINSGKYSNLFKPSLYAPRKPIQINTADIDVSATKFDKNRHARVRSTSPEPSADAQSSADGQAPTEKSVFMPRVDQHDPPQFRATIKRNRHIVRLSTMRPRSKSRSKSSSIEKRDSSRKSRSSKHSQSSDDQPDEKRPPSDAAKEAKPSWRDKFGDSLQMSAPKVVRKSPGEIIKERHMIRDKADQVKQPMEAPPSIVRYPETETSPQEIAYLEPMIRKSIRRQSLIRCPSFKDICKDISSDIRAHDDLNAGELRRRASLILEQEGQILAQLTQSVSRRPSADFINIEKPIPEVEDEHEENEKDEKAEVEPPQAENVIVIKKRTKKKGGKVRHKISVSVDVDNPVVPVLAFSPDSKSAISGSTSPKWRAVVEEIEEDHTVNKVISLPKKKSAAPEALQKSESGVDFWNLLGRRDSVYYKTKLDLKRNEMEIIEMDVDEEQKERIEEVEAALEPPAEKIAEEMKAEPSPEPEMPKVSAERRNSAVKSHSTSDLLVLQEEKPKKALKPKALAKRAEKDEAKSEAKVKTSAASGRPLKSSKKRKEEAESEVESESKTPAAATSTENNSHPNVSGNSNGEKLSKTAGGGTDGTDGTDGTQRPESTSSKTASDALKIKTSSSDETATAKSKAAAAKVVKTKTENGETPAAPKIASKAKPKQSNQATADGEHERKESAQAAAPGASASALPKVRSRDASAPKKVSPERAAAAAAAATAAAQTAADEIVNREIGSDAASDAKSSTAQTEPVQPDRGDENAEPITSDANNNEFDSQSVSASASANEIESSSAARLNKFPTLANLSRNLSLLDRSASANDDEDDGVISGEESFDLLLNSSPEPSDESDQYTDTESEDEMGLKRRHRKKKEKFDPKRVVKLDHKRKCYIVDEAPKYPLIATPRPLQKKYHYHSESDSASSSECGSSDECYDECLSPNDVVVKDVIRMSTCSNDSGFEGGGTAPMSPKKMLGKRPNRLDGNVCETASLFLYPNAKPNQSSSHHHRRRPIRKRSSEATPIACHSLPSRPLITLRPKINRTLLAHSPHSDNKLLP